MIDFKPLEIRYTDIFMDTIERAHKNGIGLLFGKKRTIDYGKDTNMQVAGYFDGEEKVLAVALGKPIEDWVEIFIHESSHMDQFIERREWFDNMDGAVNIDEWLEYREEPTKDDLHNTIMSTIDLELDCEIRAIEKIKLYEIPIDIELYARKANAYLFFYRFVEEARMWCPVGHPPYEDQELIALCPPYMGKTSDFENPPTEIMNRLREKYITNKVATNQIN